MYEEDFCNRLSKLRIQKNVSAREMSLAIGLNENYINTIENKKSFPTMQNFFYICEYLDISPKEFFDNENEIPKKIQDITNDLKKLNSKQLEIIYSLVEEFKNK